MKKKVYIMAERKWMFEDFVRIHADEFPEKPRYIYSTQQLYGLRVDKARVISLNHFYPDIHSEALLEMYGITVEKRYY